MLWNEVITTYNMLNRDNNYSVLECKAWFPFNSKFIPKILGKKYLDPGKKYTNPDWTEILIPDPIRPEKKFLKTFPDPVPDSVWSGTVRGNSRFQVALQVYQPKA